MMKKIVSMVLLLSLCITVFGVLPMSVSAATTEGTTVDDRANALLYENFESDTSINGTWSAKESDTLSWFAGGVGGSQGCAKITVPEDGEEGGKLGLSSGDVTYKKGKKYEISFWIKKGASVPEASVLNSSASKVYIYLIAGTKTEATVSGEWQKVSYIYDLTTSESDVKSSFILYPVKNGCQVTPTSQELEEFDFYYDDICIKEITADTEAKTFWDFSDGSIDTWSVSDGANGSVAYSSDVGCDGKAGVLEYTLAKAYKGNATRCPYITYSFKEGVTYELSAYIKIVSADSVPNKNASFAIADSSTRQVTGAAPTKDGWTKCSVTYTPTADQTDVGVWICARNGGFPEKQNESGVDTVVYYDNITIAPQSDFGTETLENGVGLFTKGSATSVAQSESAAKNGSYGLEVVAEATNKPIYYNNDATSFTFQKGKTYHFSTWVKVNTASTTIDISQFGVAAFVITTTANRNLSSKTNTVVNGNWQKISTTYTPEEDVTGYVRFIIDNSHNSGNTAITGDLVYYLDDFTVEEVPGAYLEGNILYPGLTAGGTTEYYQVLHASAVGNVSLYNGTVGNVNSITLPETISAKDLTIRVIHSNYTTTDYPVKGYTGSLTVDGDCTDGETKVTGSVTFTNTKASDEKAMVFLAVYDAAKNLTGVTLKNNITLDSESVNVVDLELEKAVGNEAYLMVWNPNTLAPYIDEKISAK